MNRLKEEILLLGALAVLALFLGLLVGGGFTYWYMPKRCSKVVETTSVSYQCYDGSTKGDVNECPQPSISEYVNVTAGGNNTVVVRQCDCLRDCPMCQNCVKTGGITTTTIHVPKLVPCTKDSDCGSPSYDDEIKCAYDLGSFKMYKLANQPFCDKDSYCKTKQTRNVIRSCTESERCFPGRGCEAYKEEED